MEQDVTSWAEHINWKKLIKRLIAFGKYKKGSRDWRRDGQVLPTGIGMEDVVSEAITDYLWEHSRDRNWSVTEEELEKSLRSKIANKIKDLSELMENRPQDQKHPGDDIAFFEFGATVDMYAFESDVMDALQNEPELWELFCDLYISGLERKEIIKANKFSEPEYDNRARRLRTRIEKLLTKHEITRNNDTTSRKAKSPLEST